MLIRLGPQCSVKAGRARHSVRADLGGHNGAHGVTRPTCFGSPPLPSLTHYSHGGQTDRPAMGLAAEVNRRDLLVRSAPTDVGGYVEVMRATQMTSAEPSKPNSASRAPHPR